MLDFVETRLADLGVTCERTAEHLSCTLSDMGLVTDVCISRPNNSVLWFKAAPMLPAELLTQSRYLARYHSYFFEQSAKGTGLIYQPVAHGQLVPVVYLMSDAGAPSVPLLKRVLRGLVMGSFQLATFGPRLLAYGSVEWRAADELPAALHRRANPPLVDRHAALLALMQSHDGRLALQRMAMEQFEPYRDLVDKVLFEAWLDKSVKDGSLLQPAAPAD